MLVRPLNQSLESADHTYLVHKYVKVRKDPDKLEDYIVEQHNFFVTAF